jgi:hypothetical protein
MLQAEIEGFTVFFFEWSVHVFLNNKHQEFQYNIPLILLNMVSIT